MDDTASRLDELLMGSESSARVTRIPTEKLKPFIERLYLFNKLGLLGLYLGLFFVSYWKYEWNRMQAILQFVSSRQVQASYPLR